MSPVPRVGFLLSVLLTASVAQAQPTDHLTAGTHRYHLVEQTLIQNSASPGPAAEVRRDLYVSLTLTEANGRLDARLLVDSAIVTSAQIGRLPQPAFARAEWRGSLSPKGTGQTGSIILANGAPSASPVLAALRWIFPILASEAPSDVLEITTVAMSGAERTLRASRTFARESDSTVALRGHVAVAAAGELKVDEVSASAKKDGPLTGRWTFGPGGVMHAATMTYELTDRMKMRGGEEMKTTERTTITLTRQP